MGKRTDSLVLALWLAVMWLAGRFDKVWLQWQIRREAKAELKRKVYRGRA